MFHFPNQQLYHHNPYQQCPLLIDETKLQNLNPISEAQYQVLSEDIGSSTQLLQVATNITQPTHSQVPPFPPEDIESVKIKKPTQKKLKTRAVKGADSKKSAKNQSVDTSTFSIEERLVAAVWVHERKHTRSSISEIKNNFRKRFGRDPPSKTTLFAWERKLFSTGNVCDAPRTGRPVNRKRHICEVAASVRAAPALSLRARALALRLPRSTLHNILRNDLPILPSLPSLPCATHSTTTTSTSIHKADARPPKARRRVKQPSRDDHLPPAAPTPIPTTTTSDMHYVTHTRTHTHTQGHGYT